MFKEEHLCLVKGDKTPKFWLPLVAHTSNDVMVRERKLIKLDQRERRDFKESLVQPFWNKQEKSKSFSTKVWSVFGAVSGWVMCVCVHGFVQLSGTKRKTESQSETKRVEETDLKKRQREKEKVGVVWAPSVVWVSLLIPNLAAAASVCKRQSLAQF